MIYIKKGAEPPKLQTYRRTLNARFDDMDADVKNQLREHLLKEQGHLCAYCMCRINDETDVKIEHWEPRTPGNEMHYPNLLAVCHGNEGAPERHQTCDTRKGQKPITIDPLNAAHMKRIYYSTSGEIHSTDSIHDTEMDKILNLNDETGIPLAGRKTALKQLQKLLHPYKDAKRVRAFLEKVQAKYAAQTDPIEPYVGILRWYIQHKLERL